MESCRLAVHPDHRGGAASRALTSARMRAAFELGADKLWLRCLPGSPAHGLYLRVGWSFLSRGHIDVPAEASRPAVLMQRAVAPLRPHRLAP
jgi:GNAT superfamily N-acetyltransferase